MSSKNIRHRKLMSDSQTHSLRLVKIFINCVETKRKCFKKVVEEGLKQSEKKMGDGYKK